MSNSFDYEHAVMHRSQKMRWIMSFSKQLESVVNLIFHLLTSIPESEKCAKAMHEHDILETKRPAETVLQLTKPNQDKSAICEN